MWRLQRWNVRQSVTPSYSSGNWGWRLIPPASVVNDSNESEQLEQPGLVSVRRYEQLVESSVVAKPFEQPKMSLVLAKLCALSAVFG